MNRDPFRAAVMGVVRSGNCSGCGACSLTSERVSMHLTDSGYMRPQISPRQSNKQESGKSDASLFRSICPGVSLTRPTSANRTDDLVFGPFVSSWEGWAVEPEVRFAGSSGGVITALCKWLLEMGETTSVVGSKGGEGDPRRTVSVSLSDPQGVLSMSGSRYAPVANMERFDPVDDAMTFVGKPCEASAARSAVDVMSRSDGPLLLSFFCAGTPSQHGTDRLVESLAGSEPVVSVRYRGDGWPGSFTVAGASGTVGSMSYDESWGRHIGRDIQWRCKICVDGTGGHADIAVGDFWKADPNGYPVFDSADGNSVVIARTERGHDVLVRAFNAGVLALKPLDLKNVASVQPLQVERKTTLLGRLAGRLIALKKTPRYYGYRLIRLALSDPVRVLRAAVGTARRSVSDKTEHG